MVGFRATVTLEPERSTKGAHVDWSMQSLFVLGGIALIIAGMNGSRPLVFVGLGMIVLALCSRFLGRGRS
jgi:hypothetical protein